VKRSPFELGPRDVHVWTFLCGEPVDEPLHAEHVAQLPASERARWERLKLPRKKNEYLYGKLLTRTALSRYADRAPVDWRFVEGVRGKPSIEDGGALRFNLSHTRGLLALAVMLDREVGVDVEEVEPRDPGVPERFFASEEARAVRTASAESKDRLFARYWTLKEAYIKAHGDGLAIPLQSFRFELDDPVRILFRDAADGRTDEWWFAYDDPTPRHALAVAVHAPGPFRVSWFPVALTDLIW
jgi:4'-phosphopantetheinyl transferase